MGPEALANARWQELLIYGGTCQQIGVFLRRSTATGGKRSYNIRRSFGFGSHRTAFAAVSGWRARPRKRCENVVWHQKIVIAAALSGKLAWSL